MLLVLKVLVIFCTFFCESKKKADVKHLLWMYLVISVTFTTTKYGKLCLNKYHSVKNMEITISHFFDTNIVKATFSRKSWIPKYFLGVREFLDFPHCECEYLSKDEARVIIRDLKVSKVFWHWRVKIFHKRLIKSWKVSKNVH